MSNTQAFYFGGSRHPQNINPAQISAVVSAVIASGSRVHVGCQFGADQAVINSALRVSCFLSVFAVAPFHAIPAHVHQCLNTQASVTVSAGGTTAPIHARYLLRSIAAFTGCAAAVFFAPGSGSLAVARECIRAGLPVYAFQSTRPAFIPSAAGSWVSAFFYGFPCWAWQAPQQLALF
jgi:hypothetical protein